MMSLSLTQDDDDQCNIGNKTNGPHQGVEENQCQLL